MAMISKIGGDRRPAVVVQLPPAIIALPALSRIRGPKTKGLRAARACSRDYTCARARALLFFRVRLQASCARSFLIKLFWVRGFFFFVWGKGSVALTYKQMAVTARGAVCAIFWLLISGRLVMCFRKGGGCGLIPFSGDFVRVLIAFAGEARFSCRE